MAIKKQKKMPTGLTGRILASALGGIALLVVSILWLAFGASNFTLFQSIAVLFVVMLVFAALMTIVWVPWGMKFAHRKRDWEKWDEEECKGPMNIGEKLAGIAIFITAILWLAFWAEGFTLVQKLAVLLVVALLWGAVKAILMYLRKK